MRSGLGQAQERALVRPAPDAMMAPAVMPTTKEIPYDYVARFTLTGEGSGRRVQDVINISTEGAFVAVAIGYSFIPKLPDQLLPIRLVNPTDEPPPLPLARIIEPPPVSLARIIAQSIKNLLDRVVVVAGEAGEEIREADESETVKRLETVIQPLIDPLLIHCLLVRVCGIDFKYSIIDSGTGRELQNQAIHNIAGLGEPTGDRPFRPLAKPMLFMPRSTIRIEVEEVSKGSIYTGAELFIVLHGYKMLGYGTALP